MDLILSDYGLLLTKESERLVIRRKDDDLAEAPVADIESVLIASKGCSITTDALAICAENHIPVHLVDFRGQPYAIFAYPSDYEGAALRRAQIQAATDPRGLHLLQSIVCSKLANQSNTLRYFSKSRKGSAPEIHDRLLQLSDEIQQQMLAVQGLTADSLDDARNSTFGHEGQAAQAYWEGVRLLLPDSAAWPGRRHQGATDPFNVTLNYGYGVLSAQIFTFILRARLDPYAGFLHADDTGRTSFVFDLLEEFRSFIVDRPALAWFIKGAKIEFEPKEPGRMVKTSRDAVLRLFLERLDDSTVYQGKSLRLKDLVLHRIYEIAHFLKKEAELAAFVGAW